MDADLGRPPFSQALRELVGVHADLIPELSSQVGCSRSLIYKWLSGESLPLLGSSAVDKVIEFFSLGPPEAFALQRSILESLIRRHRPAGLARSESLKAVMEALDVPPSTPHGSLAAQIGSGRSSIQRTVIHGRQNVLRAAVTMLNDCKPGLGDPIKLSLRGDQIALFQHFPDELHQFRRAIDELKRRGRRLDVVFELDVDPLHALTAFELIIGFESPHVQSIGFEESGKVIGINRQPVDYLIAETVALIMFPTSEGRFADTGIVIQDADQVEALTRHFDAAYRFTDEFPQVAMVRRSAFEQKIGGKGQIAWHATLESMALPRFTLSGSRVVRSKIRRPAAEWTRIAADQFYAGLAAGETYIDVMPVAAIESRPELRRNARSEGAYLVQARVRNLIALLKRYRDTYRLVLTPPPQVDRLRPVYCSARADEWVCLQFGETLSDGDPSCMVITDTRAITQGVDFWLRRETPSNDGQGPEETIAWLDSRLP
jgi:hypothetical protein